MNLLVAKKDMAFDEAGTLAASGTVHDGLLEHLNALEYYHQPFPKSLDNSFGSQTVLPIIESYAHIDTTDALRTYAEHIVTQVFTAVQQLDWRFGIDKKVLYVTGGGAHNAFLISQLQEALSRIGFSVEVPAAHIIDYKEALIMALLGLLRWREENTVLQSVTGAARSSIGGAVWMGQEA